ncbi:MAG: hypothetical protein ACJ72T_08525 [Nitrososphaeraceae archaeon]
MSSPETADWNNLIQKNVKTKDIGNIIMVDEEFITVLEGTRQEYVVPKKYIKELKETEIVLGLAIKELSEYEAKRL